MGIGSTMMASHIIDNNKKHMQINNFSQLNGQINNQSTFNYQKNSNALNLRQSIIMKKGDTPSIIKKSFIKGPENSFGTPNAPI